MPTTSLDPALVDRVLARLGMSRRPEPSLADLSLLYRAWCRHVPFDNIRKLIHVRARDRGALPGDVPNEFFQAWLTHGTGATCWAGNGALCELLSALGFAARRAAATMMVAPKLPPNHGSVVVSLDNKRFIVDASMLFVEPLEVAEGSVITHGAWGVAARFDDGYLTVRWKPMRLPDSLDCRFNEFDVSRAAFRSFHEATRTWSPFNYELNLNLVRGDGRIGAADGERVQIDASGAVTTTPHSGEARKRFLVEEIGISEEMADRLPADMPTPPPPGSRTAATGSR